MDRARQRRLEARERRKESLNNASTNLSTRMSDIKKRNKELRIKAVADKLGITTEEVMKRLDAKKKGRKLSNKGQNKIALSDSEQGKVTAKKSGKVKEK